MKISELTFMKFKTRDNILYSTKIEDGRITVLDRVTGYSDMPRDTETGYMDDGGSFWLASGGFDIRNFGDLTVPEAIEKIKEHANTCVGPKTGKGGV